MQYVTRTGHSLRRAAEDFEDIQRVRIRLQNRDRAYDRNSKSFLEEQIGKEADDFLSILLAEPELAEELVGAADDEHSMALRAVVSAEKVSKDVLLSLYRECVTPAIQQWQKETRGIGEHMLARLLGTIGNPYIATPLDWEGYVVEPGVGPRSVSRLWAYCGHGAPLRRKKKMSEDEARALGNQRAKMLTHLMAEQVIKAGNPDYRLIYDDEKDRFLARSEDDQGRAMTKGHAHNHALRIVGKNILTDLWVAARQDAGGGPIEPTQTQRRIEAPPAPTKKAAKKVTKTVRKKAAV